MLFETTLKLNPILILVVCKDSFLPRITIDSLSSFILLYLIYLSTFIVKVWTSLYLSISLKLDHDTMNTHICTKKWAYSANLKVWQPYWFQTTLSLTYSHQHYQCWWRYRSNNFSVELVNYFNQLKCVLRQNSECVSFHYWSLLQVGSSCCRFHS